MSDKDSNLRKNIKKAASAVDAADALLITAGAGMGVDSGLPDFRGTKGFWNEYPVIAKLGYSFSQMANPGWFNREPRLAWAFYGHRLDLYRKTDPHAGFQRLLEIGKKKSQGYFVSTSNVDGHFQKAGFDHDLVEECHGSIHHFQCSKPCSDNIWEAGGNEILVDADTFRATGDMPHCPNCGALARPNILMFGDGYWVERRVVEQEQRLFAWIDSLTNSRFVIIEIGAGGSVTTIRDHSEEYAHLNNATLIRINPREYRVPNQRHISLPLGGLEAINAICKSMQSMTL